MRACMALGDRSEPKLIKGRVDCGSAARASGAPDRTLGTGGRLRPKKVAPSGAKRGRPCPVWAFTRIKPKSRQPAHGLGFHIFSPNPRQAPPREFAHPCTSLKLVVPQLRPPPPFCSSGTACGSKRSALGRFLPALPPNFRVLCSFFDFWELQSSRYFSRRHSLWGYVRHSISPNFWPLFGRNRRLQPPSFLRESAPFRQERGRLEWSPTQGAGFVQNEDFWGKTGLFPKAHFSNPSK
jgi:hypothetical protein